MMHGSRRSLSWGTAVLFLQRSISLKHHGVRIPGGSLTFPAFNGLQIILRLIKKSNDCRGDIATVPGRGVPLNPAIEIWWEAYAPLDYLSLLFHQSHYNPRGQFLQEKSS